MIVREREKVIKYLQSRSITQEYFRAKQNIEAGRLKQVNFKILNPKKQRIYSFRITKKYRAIGHFLNDVFIVASISDHQ